MREGGRGAQILMPAPLPLQGKGGGGKGGGGGAKAAVAKVGRARTGAKGAGGGGPGEGGGGGGELDAAAGEALLSRLQAWRKAVCAADGGCRRTACWATAGWRRWRACGRAPAGGGRARQVRRRCDPGGGQGRRTNGVVYDMINGMNNDDDDDGCE